MKLNDYIRKIGVNNVSSRKLFVFLSVLYYLVLSVVLVSINRFRFLFTLKRENISLGRFLFLPVSSFTGIVLLLLGFILIGILIPYIKEEDKDLRFKQSKDKTYGDARFANLKDFKKNSRFWVSPDFKSNFGIILGKISGQIIGIRSEKGRNENGLIIGTSGSGKTSSFILPNLINSIKRRESFLTIDPKGELFRKTIRKLKRAGYKIFVLNFKNPKYSNRFNLLSGITLERDKILEVADTLFINLGYNIASGAFFEEGAKLLLTFLLSVSCELKELLDLGKLKDPEYSVNGFRVGTIGYALDLLYAYPGEETVIKNLYRLYKEMNKKYKDNQSRAFWKLFTPGEKSELNENYLANFKRITSYFFDPATLALFSGDDFEIDDGLNEPTAYFLIMNESSTSKKNRLASVFINTLMVRYEYLKDNREDEYPQRFRFILDEFGAIGNINGFENILSGCRSRNMSILFAVQDITQLKNNYRNVFDSIIGNCSLILSTGVRDDPSRTLVSELLGTTTIDNCSESRGKDGKVSVTTLPAERALMRKDELLEVQERNIGMVENTRFNLKQLRYYEEELEDEGIGVEEYFKRGII